MLNPLFCPNGVNETRLGNRFVVYQNLFGQFFLIHIGNRGGAWFPLAPAMALVGHFLCPLSA